MSLPPLNVYPFSKGAAVGLTALHLPDFAKTDVNLLREDLTLPCAVLKRSALEANSASMRAFLALTGAKLCPHGKTTMSPELMQMQLADGAWGITAANVQQMTVMRHAGVKRIMIANQVTGSACVAGLSMALDEDPELDLYCLVDSLEGVAHLDTHFGSDSGRRLQVLVEVGQLGARTGARSEAEALQAATAVRESNHLSLRGVETYEGIIQGADQEAIERAIGKLLQSTVDVARACKSRDLFAEGPVILTAGGSAYYDMAALQLSLADLGCETLVIIRSGCYLTHDAHWLENFYRRMGERAPELTNGRPKPRAAMEVWAYIQSRPEPRRAFATLGKRDISYDIDLPVPLQWFRPGQASEPRPLSPTHRVSALNDQHAYLDLPPDSPLTVGDMVAFGFSHPCTTFDKWRIIPVVDDSYRVVSTVTTWF